MTTFFTLCRLLPLWLRISLLSMVIGIPLTQNGQAWAAFKHNVVAVERLEDAHCRGEWLIFNAAQTPGLYLEPPKCHMLNATETGNVGFFREQSKIVELRKKNL
nr:hypothetical protein [Rhodoferax sp.]